MRSSTCNFLAGPCNVQIADDQSNDIKKSRYRPRLFIMHNLYRHDQYRHDTSHVLQSKSDTLIRMFPRVISYRLYDTTEYSVVDMHR